MSKLSENLKEIHTENTHKLYVHDWRDTLPAGSLWTPDSKGDPACKVCMGTGWLRRTDLYPGHPQFGKLVFCDCVPQAMHRNLEFENSQAYRPTQKQTGRA